jgi:hypothetical protein
LGKERNSVSEFWYGLNSLVQVGIGHGLLWCRGLMTGLLRGPSSPCTYNKTQNR